MNQTVQVIFIASLILLCHAEVISITNNLSGLQKPTTPQPPNCIVWTEAICEICDEGYSSDAKGVCKKDNGGIKSNGIIESEEFGQIVGEDFDPCPGKSNCVGTSFKNKNDFETFIRNIYPDDGFVYYA